MRVGRCGGGGGDDDGHHMLFEFENFVGLIKQVDVHIGLLRIGQTLLDNALSTSGFFKGQTKVETLYKVD